MGGGDDAAQCVGERGIDAAGIREAIERARLVEAPHLDRPFDRIAFALEREPPIRRARDRHDAAVELRRERPVHSSSAAHAARRFWRLE
jgi:hypothetical protein